MCSLSLIHILHKWPLIASKAKGTYFWDMDGNRYLDFMCAYGPNVLGYSDPDVDKAAIEQLAIANCTTCLLYTSRCVSETGSCFYGR